jgi:predicted phage baseplate assembly protein
MTVPALRLDDLTWAEMMEAIRERIPGASQGRWTLHAPVDPGITLLELYAWLLEQRLYLLDQVPDGLVRNVLGLLGIPAPAPAIPAATVLALRPLAPASSAPSAPASTPVAPPPGAPHPPSAVPAGTQLVRALGAQRVVFSTQHTVALIPPGPWRLLVGDRTADLHVFGGVNLLRPPDSQPGPAAASSWQPSSPPPVELVLTVPAGFDPPSDAWLGLLLELETSLRVLPSWSPQAVDDVPPPAQITWSYETSPGQFQAFEAPGELDDGTGGLRRSGVVRLAWPDAWRPAPGTPPPARASATAQPGAGPAVERRLRLTIGQASFSAPPRLLGLALNAVIARHLQAVIPDGAALERLDAQLGGWLSLPGQSLNLDAAGPSPGTVDGHLMDDPATVQLTLTERDGVSHTWTATGDLATHGPADRVFEIDRATGSLRFGDGLTGRVPVVAQRSPADPPRLSLTYQLGGGEDGNLGVVPWSCDTIPIEAISAVPASFGQAPETIEQARGRAASELARPTRAVTVPDFEQIALDTPGVDIARAHVAVGLHPATPCDPVPGAVTVVIVPGVSGDRSEGQPDVAAPTPDPGAITAVTAALEAARLIGTEVFVRGPRYRAVRLAVTPSSAVADPAWLQRRLLDGLRLHLDPLGGGPEAMGWVFGEPLRPPELLGVAQRLAGRSAVIEAVAVGLDGVAPAENCLDVAIGVHDLVVLAGLVLTGPPAGDPTGAAASTGPGGLS